MTHVIHSLSLSLFQLGQRRVGVAGRDQEVDELDPHSVHLAAVGNALKFTPSGGSITLRLGHQDTDVVLEVIDTGIGIPEEQLERIKAMAVYLG